jgi:hypothetical protein
MRSLESSQGPGCVREIKGYRFVDVGPCGIWVYRERAYEEVTPPKRKEGLNWKAREWV